MLAYYYQVSTNKSNNETQLSNYYNNILGSTSTVQSTAHQGLPSRCRICLKTGHSSIYEHKNSEEIIEALNVFGSIAVNQEDHTKLMCSICFMFIKQAILFRKIATQSNEILEKLKETKVKVEVTFEDEKRPTIDLKKQAISNKNNTQICSTLNVMVENKSNSEKEKIDNEAKKENAKVPCHICNKVLSGKSALKQHLFVHDPDCKKYVCHVCGKTFRLHVSYYQHSLRHRTDFPYKCLLCPYRGQCAQLLKSHMRSHNRDYRYMCTECPARFIYVGNLNAHVLKKHKVPQFKCDTCMRVFHTKQILEKHDCCKLGIKNQVCNVCEKAFGTRKAMMRHERRVHKREKKTYRRMPSYLKAEIIENK